MYSLHYRKHGYLVVLEGLVDLAEVQELTRQCHDEWAGTHDPFVWVVDARSFEQFTADGQAEFETLLEQALDAGLIRITVLAISTALAGLFCNIMVRAEAMPLYQFLDLAYEEDFLTEMDNWLNEPFASSTPTPP